MVAAGIVFGRHAEREVFDRFLECVLVARAASWLCVANRALASANAKIRV
jgi:hypothetical protein